MSNSSNKLQRGRREADWKRFAREAGLDPETMSADVRPAIDLALQKIADLEHKLEERELEMLHS